MLSPSLIENPSILFCHQIQYKLKLHVSLGAYIPLNSKEVAYQFRAFFVFAITGGGVYLWDLFSRRC